VLFDGLGGSLRAAQRITRLRRILICFPWILFVLLVNTEVHAENQDPPPYPDGEPVYLNSEDLSTYQKVEKVSIFPCSVFPEIDYCQQYSGHWVDNVLSLTAGTFSLQGYTGPEGYVTGNFSFSATNQYETPSGKTVSWSLEGNGTVNNARAGFDINRILYIGQENCEPNSEILGSASIIFNYLDDRLGKGSRSKELSLSGVYCKSDLEGITTCSFELSENGPKNPGIRVTFENDASIEKFGSNTWGWFCVSGLYELIGDAQYSTPEPTSEESIMDESYLEAPIKAENLKDNPKAGFTLEVYCNDDLLPNDSINCRSVLSEGEIGYPYTVNWILDGFILKTSLQPSGTDTFTFPNPPPGKHTVTVQAINQNNNETRVTSTLVNVQVGEDLDKVKPWVQTAAAAGSVAILGAWLWAEWLVAKAQVDSQSKADEAADEVLSKNRKQWFEEIMDLNKQEYATKIEFEKNFGEYQNTCENEWKRFREELLKVTGEFHKSDYLIDLYDDMLGDVHRDGIWDGKALQRLEELINTHLRMDRHLEASELLRDRLNSLEKSQKSYDKVINSWTMCGLQMAVGVLTGGASEVVLMPARAIENALYASRRAEILGLTGWEAAKSVMVESGCKLAQEYIWAKGTQKLVNRYGKQAAEYGGKKLVNIFGKDRVDAVAKWWSNNLAPKPKPELPVIHQKWGQGPQVFVHKPIFKQGPMPQVDLGMENYLTNRIRPVSPQLADDLGTMFREGVDVNPNLNNLLLRGSRYTIGATDQSAIRIMSNPAYKTAVGEGLIPASAQQAVYQARDKVCKNAILETLERMDNMLIGGKQASSYIKSVAITGTGAKPLSPQGLGHFTDFDGTVNGGESVAEREAERLFSRYFQKAVERSGVNSRVAEINMFSGIRPSPGGYSSAPLLHWHRVDMINRGRLAVRTNQGIMFDVHPDVAPLPRFSPLGTQPHFPVQPVLAKADAGQMVVDYVNQRIRETGQELSKAEILRAEGKHAIRVWKAINAGRGERTPEFIQKLNALKNDRSMPLTQKETETLWKSFTEYLNLPKELGG
jgi:hypothetical protein